MFCFFAEVGEDLFEGLQDGWRQNSWLSNVQHPAATTNTQHLTTNNISFSLRLFLDGDCRVEPTHLKDMFHYLITENLAACGCFLLTEKVALKLKTTGASCGGKAMPRVPTRYLLEKLQKSDPRSKTNDLPPIIIEEKNWVYLHRTVITFFNIYSDFPVNHDYSWELSPCTRWSWWQTT